MTKISIGILGATGVVGQHYVQLLANHPWFEITFLAASASSADQSYESAVTGRWRQSDSLLPRIGYLPVYTLDALDIAQEKCDLVFSAISGDLAKEYEEQYAKAGISVVSNAATHRRDPHVPLLIPEVNSEHLEIIPAQRRQRGWEHGLIAVKPNCSIQSYLIPLWPLHQRFGLEKIVVTTLQAVSGAGYPGLPAKEIANNVIPYIADEEEKSEWEPLKILGKIESNLIINAKQPIIAAHCNRVPVCNGHMACVSVAFKIKPSAQEILEIWKGFRGLPQQLELPSAPEHPIIYMEDANRPQPRLDSETKGGMAITVGRLRPCPVLDYRFVGLSHNALRGAAGGGVLIAELLAKQQYIHTRDRRPII